MRSDQMLHHPTLDQLAELRLHGMAQAYTEMQGKAQADELAHGEWLALLLDREAAERPDGSTGPCSSNSRPANGSPRSAT